MEPVSLTEDEIQLALSKGKWNEAWITFLRFLASEIVSPENSMDIPTEQDYKWEAWYMSFVSRSVMTYASLVPFPGKSPSSWLVSVADVTKLARKFVSSIVGTVREKRATIAKQQDVAGDTPGDADPPDYSTNAAPSGLNQEKMPASIATTGNPRPPIRFRTTQRRPGSDGSSDIVYLYFHSPPSLQSLLPSLRKRHDLCTGDKIVSLHVKMRYARIRIMIGEEQEEWDWEGAMEEVSGDGYRATIIFEVQPE